MKKFPALFVSDKESSANISRAVKAGLIRKIGPRLYTSNMKDDPEMLVRQNAWQIVSLLLPGAVVSHRSALENKISPNGRVYVTGGSAKVISLPGLEIVVLKGHGPLPNRDMPMLQLFMACRERGYLENLLSTKDKGSESKILPRNELEEKLVAVLRSGGEIALNAIRDRSKEVAHDLGMNAEFKKLDNLIGTILGTRTLDLASPLSQAYSVGEGYDPQATERFAILRAELAGRVFKSRPMPTVDRQVFYNASFFDAYFSNFIEGTEFEVEEAIGIIESGVVPVDRPEDGHDILGTYRVVGSIDEMTTIPHDFQEFMEILTRRHATIMEGRTDKRPGRFKEKPNIAGLTRFVEPTLVRGTLRQAFEFYRGLVDPFARALFIMFTVSDIHPFDDGNGRVARTMMNAELVAKGETRIIIPSVFRGEYLSGLKRMTNEADPIPFIKQLDYVQEFYHRIDLTDLDRAIEMMRNCNSFAKPEDTVRLKMPPPRSDESMMS